MSLFLYPISFVLSAFAAEPPKAPLNLSPHDQFRALTDAYTEASQRLDPLYDYYYYADRPGSDFGNPLHVSYKEKSKKLAKETLKKFHQLQKKLTDKTDLETGALLEEMIEHDLNFLKLPYAALIDTNHLSNRIYAYAKMGNDLESYPFEEKSDFENYIKRANGIKAWADDYIRLLNQSQKTSFKLSSRSVELLIKNWESLMTEDFKNSYFYHPILLAEKKLKTEEINELKKDYEQQIKTNIYPQIGRLIKALKEIQPFTRSSFGIYKIDGKDRYYDLYKKSNTDYSTLSAKEIHEIGLNEVNRIQQEMTELQKKLGKENLTFKEFLNSIRENPKSYFESFDDLLKAFRSAESTVNKEVPKYFSNIPPIPLELRGIPDLKAPAGSYSPITDKVNKAYFDYNSGNLKATNRYITHTLFLHEGIPGHHFQLSINYLLKSKLGKFRTELVWSTPFVEGWALYAEYLGREMGVYSTPELLLGHLDDEMLRAVRLVVDTGMHSFGWSREKCLEFALSHLSSDKDGIESEIDRYSVWPGQALGYKIGQLEFKSLRKNAETKLGSKFDIKAFHSVLLESGSITMGLTRKKVDQWIKSL